MRISQSQENDFPNRQAYLIGYSYADTIGGEINCSCIRSIVFMVKEKWDFFSYAESMSLFDTILAAEGDSAVRAGPEINYGRAVGSLLANRTVNP